MRLLRYFIIISLLLFVAGFLAYQHLGSLIRKGVEHGSPSLLGVSSTIGEASVKPIQGSASFNQFVIGNPSGFSTSHAFRLEAFDIELVPLSLFSDTIHIRKLSIQGADILCDGILGDNHRRILSTIRENAAARSGKKQGESEEAGEKRFVIDRFELRDASLRIVVDGTEITRVDFPTLELDGIGTKESGVTAAEALSQIYGAVMSQTDRTLTINRDDIRKLMQSRLNAIGIQDPKQLLNPSQLLKQPETVEKIAEALGSFLGGQGGQQDP